MAANKFLVSIGLKRNWLYRCPSERHWEASECVHVQMNRMDSRKFPSGPVQVRGSWNISHENNWCPQIVVRNCSFNNIRSSLHHHLQIPEPLSPMPCSSRLQSSNANSNEKLYDINCQLLFTQKKLIFGENGIGILFIRTIQVANCGHVDIHIIAENEITAGDPWEDRRTLCCTFGGRGNPENLVRTALHTAALWQQPICRWVSIGKVCLVTIATLKIPSFPRKQHIFISAQKLEFCTSLTIPE